MHELIPRNEYRLAHHRIDPVDEGMSQVESQILEIITDGGMKADKVALRLIDESYIVVVRTDYGSLKLSFDHQHVPLIIKPADVKLIAKGIIEAYREAKAPKKLNHQKSR